MSIFVPGVAVTFNDAAYAPNAIAMPAAMRITPRIWSNPSARERPVFSFISAISALNWSTRSIDWLVMLRSSLAHVCGRQLGFHRGRCPEIGDPASDHDPHPVGDTEHGARELFHNEDGDALL